MIRRPHLNRRSFLAAAAAGVAALPTPSLAAPTVLRAMRGTAQIGPPESPPTEIWGYGGSIPGPVIRIPRGGRLVRRFVNDLPQPSTVHWHGIRIDNAMDGVPGLTQPAVPPGESFLYDFTVPDAGTYWYHSHNRTWEQMARGLYGALIVEEELAPLTDADIVLVLDDWRLSPDGALDPGFGSMRDRAHAGRIGNWITVNGRFDWQRQVRRNDRLRLRLINAANARIFTVGVKNLDAWVVALDGQALAAPERFDTLDIAPAQRVDLIADVTAPAGEDALVYSVERAGSFALAVFTPGAERRAAPLPPPAPLPRVDLPEPGVPAHVVQLHMAGGAMGGMRSALLRGVELGMRELVDAGMAWAFNGTAGMPDQPLLVARRGETVRIEMWNDTAWPHAIHLHGHHFRTVGKDGSGPFRDTILVDPRARQDIHFVADNPGNWLLHCHMLEHAAAGMTTWIRVVI